MAGPHKASWGRSCATKVVKMFALIFYISDSWTILVVLISNESPKSVKNETLIEALAAEISFKTLNNLILVKSRNPNGGGGHPMSLSICFISHFFCDFLSRL